MSALVTALERDADAIATEVLQRMTSTTPEMFERYGDVGKVRCYEDTVFHVRHLAAALDTGEQAEFAAYVRWLTDLLVPRGVPEADIEANFSALADVLKDRYGDAADTAVSFLGRGATM